MSGKAGVVQRLGPLAAERAGEGTRGERGTPAEGSGKSGMIAAVILLEDLIHRINATNPLENAWARLERGEIDRDTFDAAFAAEAARMLPGDADGGDGPQLRKVMVSAALPSPVRITGG
jgi:hypothetical protein